MKTRDSSRRALILPGTDGYPGENWFPWLAKCLRDDGYSVDVPELPVEPNHSLENWFAAFDEQCSTEDTNYRLCVSHSLGTAFALRLVERQRASFDRLISVAGCIGKVDIDRFDTINRSFVADPFQWELLRREIPSRVVLYSDNDPYISIPHSTSIADGLGVRAISIGAAGHVNAAAGYVSLPVLLPFLPDSEVDE